MQTSRVLLGLGTIFTWLFQWEYENRDYGYEGDDNKKKRPVFKNAEGRAGIPDKRKMKKIFYYRGGFV